jgi:acetyl esterase
MVRLLTGLPPAALRALARPPAGATAPVDPHVRMVLALRRYRRYPGLSLETPELTRAFMRAQAALARDAPTAVAGVRDLTVTGAAGDLPARHYANPNNAGLLMFVHGGGFVAGDLDTHDEPCRVLCATTGVNVLSVHYRLAPEHPFPAAVDDVVAAYAWTLEHLADLGGGPVAVGGDSAGANLATVLCQLTATKRCDEPPPAAQLLFYPPTRHDPQWPSRLSYADGFLLTCADIDFFRGLYAAGDEPDFRHSPLLGAGCGPLPPAVLVTAEFDPLRDEGEAYADALRAAGTTVDAVRVPGMVHGFVNLTTLSPAARRAVVDAGLRLNRLLEAIA